MATKKREKLYRIAPIKWRQEKYGREASTIFGRVTITQPYRTMFWTTKWPVVGLSGYYADNQHRTESQAKAAVESWYRRQLCKALVEFKRPTPTGEQP